MKIVDITTCIKITEENDMYGIVNKVCRKKQNRIVRAAVYSSGPLASHHKTSNGTDANSNLLLKIQLPSCHPSS